MDRWLAGCKQEAIDFRGMLYPGIMLTQDGPKVLEFNARFGDPETQVYLMRLKNDLPELLMASASGNLQGHELRWDERASTCVVMASGGYPEAYPKGKVIHGLPQVADLEDVHVFHAGTARDDSGAWVTSGGRVLGVTALGADLQKATQKAYLAVEKFILRVIIFVVTSLLGPLVLIACRCDALSSQGNDGSRKNLLLLFHGGADRAE